VQFIIAHLDLIFEDLSYELFDSERSQQHFTSRDDSSEEEEEEEEEPSTPPVHIIRQHSMPAGLLSQTPLALPDDMEVRLRRGSAMPFNESRASAPAGAAEEI
jgi:hypothetical protein